MWTRRQLLAALGALGAIGPNLSFAGSGSGPDRPRLVLVLLRGGLDGLAAVQPHGVQGRGDPGPALDAEFALHPALAPLLPWWSANELAVVHALGSPYGGRSHFDAMDVLENGTDTPGARHDGWLNRALDGRGTDPVAIGPSLPLVLRGAADAGNVSGRGSPRDDRLIDAVLAMYEGDPVLGPVLREGLELRAMVDEVGGGRDGAKFAGSLLAAPDGPDVAVLQVGGFDTHARQGPVLDARLGDLAKQALALREALGPTWDRTVVCAVSEFGRTVAPNGTAGTDHGRAGVALVFGGAVRGGLYGAWPGLSHLYEGRDLMPTTDTRALFKALLAHLQVPESTLEDSVFPDSRAVPGLEGLLRA